jgi:hypothetical protein
VAARLRGAAAIGNVEAIEAIVQELLAGGPSDAAWGSHVARLAAAFDYDGLLTVAAAAEHAEGQPGANN